MKKHVISLYGLVVLLIASQVISFVFISGTISSLRDELNTTSNQLKDKINENYIQTQGQITQLTSSLSSTEKSLTKQLSEIKASASSDFSGIIETAVNSVVSIKTDVSQGSGFIVTSDGYIVTNAHVLNGAHYAKILTYNNDLIASQLIGYDTNLDVAILKISGNYDYLEFADSDNAKVGEKVIAVGNPYGLSFSVTEGIVSAVHRDNKYIQTDVPLNPGNSGGPLIDNKGKVLGMNNFKFGGAEALGFALESNIVKTSINIITQKAINQTII